MIWLSNELMCVNDNIDEGVFVDLCIFLILSFVSTPNCAVNSSVILIVKSTDNSHHLFVCSTLTRKYQLVFLKFSLNSYEEQSLTCLIKVCNKYSLICVFYSRKIYLSVSLSIWITTGETLTLILRWEIRGHVRR